MNDHTNKKKEQPHKHHYVPQFYLAGFTNRNDVDSNFFVLDLKSKIQRESTPKKSAYQHDFHRVDTSSSNQEPMYIENSIAQLESKQSSVIKKIIQDRMLPSENDDDYDFQHLLCFVAFMIVRVPRFRQLISENIDHTSKKQLRSTFSSHEVREHFKKAIKANLDTLDPLIKFKITKYLDNDPDLTKLAEYANSGDYDVIVEQTYHVKIMIDMVGELMPVIAQRNWALWIAEDNVPDLICSDSPVSLTWEIPNNGPYPPGFELPNTLLTIPLNRRVLLISKFEEIETGCIIKEPEIAKSNTRTKEFASQVFSPEKDFVWMKKDGSIGRVQDLISA